MKRDFTYKGDVVNIEQHLIDNNLLYKEELDKTLSNVKKAYWENHVADGILFDNVISDLDKDKTKEEYKYIFEHFYIYTHEDLTKILATFINHSFDEYPDLLESYNEAVEHLK
jgi:hypothetical protein